MNGVPARWWRLESDGRLRCSLCPGQCRLREGQGGFCYIRFREGEGLYTDGWGTATGFALDPIEKKPLYHFFPGANILSFGTAGCNLGCLFCQNWSTTKAHLDQKRHQYLHPEGVAALALQHGARAVAFTYNEPGIFGEYVLEVSRAASSLGLKNVMVTNGYLELEPAREIYSHIHAANVDLKAFSERFYRKMTLSHLQPVLDFLVWLRRETSVWIEVTTLLIEGENDDPGEIHDLSAWIRDQLGPRTPLHFSAFYPAYRLQQRPPTSTATVLRAREIAMKAGLYYVYGGNIRHSESGNTYCPHCGRAVIERSYLSLVRQNLKNGRCAYCNEPLDGVF